MRIGVPKEIKPQENRIGLTPDSVKTLVSEGHEVLIESNGGKIVSNVTKKLDYLVIGEKPTTKKVDLAKKNKIKVINQKTLDKMLN